jgi:hypothetical protein
MIVSTAQIMNTERKLRRDISILSVLRAWITSAAICAVLAFLSFKLSNLKLKPPYTAMGDIAFFFLKPGLLLWLRLGLEMGRAGLGNWLDAVFVVAVSALAWSIPLCAILVLIDGVQHGERETGRE